MRKTLIAALILLAACTGPTAGAGDVRVVPDRNEYAPGEPVQADFVNATDDRVGYGACSLSLERRTAAGWMRVGPAMVPCISILYVLEPGNSVRVTLPLDAALPAGSYRLRQEILPGTTLPTRDVYSPVIRVQPR